MCWRLEAGGAAGRVYNIACGAQITLNELVAHLNELLGTDLPPVYAEPRRGEVRHSLADISRARDELGYEPVIGLREGLRRTAEALLTGIGPETLPV